MTNPNQSQEGKTWMLSISYCAICDKDRDPLDVPSESCGHDLDQRRNFDLPVVPKAQLDSLQEENDRLRELAEAGYGAGVQDTHTVQAPLTEEWKQERQALQERLEEAREAAVRDVVEALRNLPYSPESRFRPDDAADFIEREFLARIEEESG